MKYSSLFITALLYSNLFLYAQGYTSGGILHPNQASYDVTYYDLDFHIDPEKQFLKGTTTAHINILERVDSLKFDLVNAFTVRDVKANERRVPFNHQDDALWVDIPPYNKGKFCKIQVKYDGHPPTAVNPPWDGGFTWEEDGDENPWIGMSCANEGGKVFFPCKDHPSDRADSMAISVTVPKGLSVASNGILLNVFETDNGSTYNWITRYPIANYNINFTIGVFAKVEKEFTSISKRKMPVIFYVLKENEKKASAHLDMAMKMIRSHENYFGEYPFINEKFGLVETPYLGMEHQTINAYGNQFRYTELGGEPVDWLLLHEMGHEWWGNKVNAADWSDYWIHEGICSYADALYHRELAGEEGYHKKMANARHGIQNVKPIIPKRNASTDEVYQGDIYGKGSYMMHSLRFIMGDRRFFRVLKEFVTNNKYTYKNLVLEKDFTSHFSDNASQNLSPFIHMMLYTTDLPIAIINKVKQNRYALSVESVGMKLPVEVKIGDRIRTITLSSDPVVVRAIEKPVIDPNHWYLWRRDFDEKIDH